ncbi:IS110 family transposase [Sinomonas sp.]|uniref:IS110 family transposase n=1 Tax=Sinomonas sp. TaxID=1914986 RepID=UPI002FE3DBE0
MPRLWAGIDAGKAHHHCVAIDEDGRRVLSRRVANNETELLALITDVLGIAESEEVVWATDLNQGGAALVISLLVDHGQPVLYIPGRTVHHASRTYRGDGKSDAKDAAIIADQARMRRDLQPIRGADEIAVELRLLVSHRTDLVCDRTRAFNRLRANLLQYFPALEAAFDYSRRKGSLVLLTKYQTPDGIRRAGAPRIEAWLRKQGVRSPAELAQTAVEAANRQHATITGQKTGAMLVAKLAADIVRLTREIEETEDLIEARFREHGHAEILLSVPGFGPQLAAEFIAATGGTLTRYESADRLAGVAGLAPVPRDSGRTSGNRHRPKRYDRRLLRACYLAAQVAANHCPLSQAYYTRKRAEGKSHKQAVLALARRRINVIWALLRDGRPFEQRASAAAQAA